MTASFDSSGASFQLVICVLTLGLLAVFVLLWRGFRSIQSRFYVVREKRLALELSVLMEEKCKLLEKVSLAQKETMYKNLERDKSQLEDEILLLEKKLEEERAKHYEQDELMTDILKTIQSLESASEYVKIQLAEAKTNISIFQMNEKHLKEVIQDTLNENYQLEESLKELLEEFEKTKEQTDELNNQKAICGRSKVQAEQVLNEKENEIKSLMESLMKTKVWTCLFGDYITDDDGPVSSKLELRKNETQGDPVNSTLPNSVPAESEGAGPGSIPSPVPQDRDPRGPPIAEDPRSPVMSRPPLSPPPTLGNIHAGPPDSVTSRDFAGPPFPPYPDEPKSSEMVSMKNYSKSKPGKSTVPISPPATFEAAGPGFIPPPFPQDRVPTGPPFAGDSRSPVKSRPPPFPPPPPGNIHPVPPGYFTPRDFNGPPFPPPPRDFPGLHLPPYPDEPESSEMTSTKTDSKSDTGNSTMPNPLPAEFEAAGPGFISSPVPQDRGPRSLPFAGHPRSPIMRRPPPFPAPPPGNMHADPPGYLTPRHFNGPYLLPACPPDRFHPRDFPGPPFLPYPVEPESLEMTTMKNDRKSDPEKSTLPNTPPPEFEAAGNGFISPPFPQDRGPRGPLFAGDARSPVMSRPPPFPPPPPGNMHAGPPGYFTSRDFAGPPFPPAGPPDYFSQRDFAGPPFLPYPGQPYSDAALKRQSRHHSKSGRLRGQEQPRKYMPPLLEVDEPESSEMTTMKNNRKSDPEKSTLPNTPPPEFEAAGNGFISPPFPQDRGPRGPLFAGDARSPVMSRPPPFPPPPPGNMHAGPPGYFTSRDFAGPPFPPAGPPDYFSQRDFAGPPFLPYPGQPYSDAALKRQSRHHSKSGRLRGREQPRKYMPPLLEVDEPLSPEMTSTKNNRKSDPGKSTVPNTPPPEFEAAGNGFISPPFPQDRGPRGPLFAGDARSPVMSRPPPFPPPPPGNMHAGPPGYFTSRDFDGPPFPPAGPPDYFLQRDFAGPPFPPARPPDYFSQRDFAGPPFLPYPGRNVFESRGFPPFFPPRAGFVPPPPHAESRNELPPQLILPSKQPVPACLETQET
ncbi:basic proline-rich protein-like isoform X1 [Cricetulus griseus]|uniref:basic proline-rich protein-like isoform X1 n=1 Tax=Cricetulus griseus TaxID=10029 RepID=UPI0015C2D65D|nr:basic proline-rich protein-like isoform X1 [Cricetulus griseus]